MAPIGVAMIGGGLFAKQEHMVRTLNEENVGEYTE
jgi:hypothetical protein